MNSTHLTVQGRARPRTSRPQLAVCYASIPVLSADADLAALLNVGAAHPADTPSPRLAFRAEAPRLSPDSVDEPPRGASGGGSQADKARSLLAGDPAVVLEVRRWICSALSRQRRTLASESEDLEQEVLLQLLEALDRGLFRGESRFETYVYSFARHRSIDRVRALSRRPTVDIADLDLPAAGPSPYDEANRREKESQARAVMSGLSPACREIWSMIVQGLSYREMSQRLGLTEGALRVRAHRCRQRAADLYDELARERVTKSPSKRPIS